ncbi:hypothetical protein BGX28_001609 [Mortierella sp. GBA30]|nr:hypothetical protein BGX28_001609 [Mortierella sp. GBA30]
MASSDKKTFDEGAVVHTDSASLIALAAAVAKHDEKFQQVKGKKTASREPRSVKKPTVWQRQNAGLTKRAGKHDTSYSSEDPEGESARRAAMERKAKIYQMLKRGEDVPDRLREELLVEFEYKNRKYGSEDDSDSDDRRMCRSRDRRRSRSRSRESDWDRDESVALARDPKDFKDAIDKQEWIRDATGEMAAAASSSGGGGGYSTANMRRHYDSTAERRAHGVGFYAFSQDEDERQRQMRELLEMRSETEIKRLQHRTLRDKRREEIEARKKLIQQKRLKSLANTITVSTG